MNTHSVYSHLKVFIPIGCDYTTLRSGVCVLSVVALSIQSTRSFVLWGFKTEFLF